MDPVAKYITAVLNNGVNSVQAKAIETQYKNNSAISSRISFAKKHYTAKFNRLNINRS